MTGGKLYASVNLPLGNGKYKRKRKLVETKTEKTFGAIKDRIRLSQSRKITPDVLRRYKRERLKDVSITPINREFALLRSMFKKAKYRKWVKESHFDLGENLIEIALEGRRNNPMTDRLAFRLLARSRKSEQSLLHYLILVTMNTGASKKL